MKHKASSACRDWRPAPIGPDGKAVERQVNHNRTGNALSGNPEKGMATSVNASHTAACKDSGSNGLRLSNGGIVPKDSDVVGQRRSVAAENATTRHCLKGGVRTPSISSIGTMRKMRLIDSSAIHPHAHGRRWHDGASGHFKAGMQDGRRVGWLWPVYRIAYQKDCPRSRRLPNMAPPMGTTDSASTSFRLISSWELRVTKHIPRSTNSARSPFAWNFHTLAGLIDNDGYVEHGGCDWINVSNVLAEDFAFVCRSVGLSAYITPCKKAFLPADSWEITGAFR